MVTNKAHSKYEHVYVVIRIDQGVASGNADDSVMVTKVFESEDNARKETERMNLLNGDKGSLYFYSVGRLVKDKKSDAV